jgi:NAD(P)-dependent dehydrogenase (short-subunit alcohol dehydrogenase family)
MTTVLVTGANKGIGLAIVNALLDAGCRIFLGARDVGRGTAARDAVIAAKPAAAASLEVVQLDVTSDESVSAAARHVSERVGGAGLGVLINNAGGATAFEYKDHADYEATIALNFDGVVRVTNAFLPLLNREAGRVVMISSAAGPSFVAKVSPARQKVLCDPLVTHAQVQQVLADARAISASAEAREQKLEAFGAAGLGDGGQYGLTKACLNALTLALAREHPNLKINACSPGFIETDLTRPFAAAKGKSPVEMGMKAPEAGTTAACFLAIDPKVPTPAGTAWYYGSDALRSPLHKYRSPGDPPYDGTDAADSSKEFLDAK